MKTGVSVGDVMTEHPITVGQETTLQQCACVMNDHHVGAVIVEEKGKLLGIVTEQDIVRKSVIKGEDAKKRLVKDIMASHLQTIKPSSDIFEAITMMTEENIRHLPVLQNGSFIGVVTLKDILKIQPELFQLLVDKIELREEERKTVRHREEHKGEQRFDRREEQSED